MGIRGLEPIIRTAGNNNAEKQGVTRVHLSELQGKRVCFDTSEFVHRSTNKNPDAHVSGIFNLIVKTIDYVRPMFVFDGKPPKEKMRTLDERRRIKIKAQEKLNTLSDMVSQAAELKDTVETIKQMIQSGDVDENKNNLIFSMTAQVSEDDTQFKVWSNGEPDEDLMSSISSASSLQDIFTDEVLAGGGQVNMSTDEFINKIQEHIDRLNYTTEKTKKKTHRLTDKQIQEIKTLLECFGIPYVHVDIEADAVCATLVKLGIADYGASNDMDLLAFGCPAIMRNINFNDDYVDIYEINNIIPQLDITHAQFIDMCIILGCDYADRLIGLKNSMALPLIKKYGTIENIVNNIDNINEEIEADDNLYYESVTNNDLELTQQNNTVKKYKLKISDEFDYNDARRIFGLELDTEYVRSLVAENAFDNTVDICNKIRLNPIRYKEVFDFCNNYCVGLNAQLITRKMASILNASWINNDTTAIDDTYTMVSNDRRARISEVQPQESKYWPACKKHTEFSTRAVVSSSANIPVISSRTNGHKWLQKPTFTRVEFGSSPSRSISY